MSKSTPAFQFYPGDWLSSLKIQLMTPAEEGAYIRLLAYAWQAEDCGLPDDDLQLSVLSRLGEGWFNGSSQRLKANFFSKRERLYNARLLQERKKQEEWRRKSRDGGIKSGKIRRLKDKEPEGWLKGGSDLVEPKGNSSSSVFSLQSSSSSSVSKEKEKPSITPLTRTDKLTKEDLQEISRLALKIERHYQQKFNITLWIQNNIGMNPHTHLHVLRRICAEGDKDKWPDFPKAYADKIASVEEGNYNEKEHMAQAKANKNVFTDLLNDLKRVKGE